MIRLLWERRGRRRLRGRVLQAEGRRARAARRTRPAGRRSGSRPTSRACSGSRAARATAGCRRRCRSGEYAERAARRSASASVAAGRPEDAVTPGMLAYVIVGPDEEAVERIKQHPLVRLLCVLLPSDDVREARDRAAARQRRLGLPRLPADARRPRGGTAARRGDPAAHARLLRVLRHGRPGRRGVRAVPRGRASATRSSGTSRPSATRRSPGSRSRR